MQKGFQSNSSGRNNFDLNKRALIAFRKNGQGYVAMTTFCWCRYQICLHQWPKQPFEDLTNSVQTAQESIHAMAEAAKTVYSNLANINTNTNSR